MPNRLYDELMGGDPSGMGFVDSSTGLAVDRQGQYVAPDSRMASEVRNAGMQNITGSSTRTAGRTITPPPPPRPTVSTGTGFTSSVVPSATIMSESQTREAAKQRFLEDFGQDPNWQAKLAEYQGDVEAAYEAILGEGGPLAEGRRLAEESFRRQEENVQTGFRQSRQQLAEQSFLGERQMQQQLAARGLGGSGLAQLGGVQQQISQGRAQTDLYSQFTRSLENLAASEAKSAQQFLEVESNLRMALSQQKLSLKRDIDQRQQEYDRFKGQTIGTLQQAIQSNNYQQYQTAMQDYGLLQDLRRETEQRRLDSLSYTTQLIERSFNDLILEAEQTMKNKNEREETIRKLRADLLIELDKAGRDLSRYDEGLSPGSLVGEIRGRYSFATQPTGAPLTPEQESAAEAARRRTESNRTVTGAGVTALTPEQLAALEANR
jgi:hypothetical protein